MAAVFEGQHPQLGSRVALKMMSPALAAQPLAAARFLREAKAASQIKHQNVVEVFDVGTQDGVPFMVMEFLEGSDLAGLLAKKGALPLTAIVDIFLPVVSAVSTAHREGIIHRDLKPANLMLTQRAPRGTHPIVLDFGISKILSDEMDGPLTQSESVLGTVQYMAPELTRAARFASTASDQYAVGVMLYECATGRLPFTGDGVYELMHAIVTARVTPPSELQPSLPAAFDAVVLRAMHRNPAERFPSVQALGRALMSFGDKAAWALWEAEFVRAASDVHDPWSKESGTLHDARAAAPTSPQRRKFSDRWARWIGIALAAYAVVTSILLSRRAHPSTDTPPAAAAPASESPVSASLPSMANSSTPSTPEAVDRVETPTDPSPSEVVPRQATLARPRRKLPPSSASSTPLPPPAPPTSALPKPSVGTNGAVIVD